MSTARQSAARALTKQERAVLEAARSDYAAWRDGLAPLRPAQFTALRKAAADFAEALEPFAWRVDTLDSTAARLLGRMQQADPHASARHADDLRAAHATAALVARALAADVSPGNRADADAHLWVAMAADAWSRAGMPVAARGRFADALREFRGARLPAVGGEAFMRDAVRAWRSGGHSG